MATTEKLVSWRILICPECGHHATYDFDWLGDPPLIFCLNHEDEPGREDRPAHEWVEVVPRSDLDELHRELGLISSLQAEVERLRAAIQGALNSDLAGTEHDPEWRACRDAVMTDLRRALMPPAERSGADE
jgi:hypothetical protein